MFEGPKTEIAQYIHKEKYRGEYESWEEFTYRIANGLKDNDEHFHALVDIIGNQKFLPAGRIQAAMGALRKVTALNCFVSMTIPDSMDGIMKALGEAAETMRKGGGIGFDFSTLRPRGAKIKSLDSSSSGPIAFMDVFNSMCGTISSAGHRRGAMMGVLRVDHPDIEEFIDAKTNSNKLTNFNISVAVTDEFMLAVINDTDFDLVFNGEHYATIRATYLWDKIMRAVWDWAEPGVLFIDTINMKNNLGYCETIASTNPCGEQPLPPHGACLLGSVNLTKYINSDTKMFNLNQLAVDIPHIVRAMDNVIDRTIYPIEAQKLEAQAKRRLGIGVTGLANAIELKGYPYGSKEFLREAEYIFEVIMELVYLASVDLAKEKGPFPLYDKNEYLGSRFIRKLPFSIQDMINEYGIRNSHLISYAPTGTISLAADNVSSGIEPVFMIEGTRRIREFDEEKIIDVVDYGYANWGVIPKTADQVPVEDHVKVLCLASKYCDSAVSKTCNVGDDVTWEQFKDVYMQAYIGGASGCTTFRLSGKRFGIMESKKSDKGKGCTFDPETGIKTCEE